MSESGLVDLAPKVGEKLVDFTLSNQLGEQRSLASIRENAQFGIEVEKHNGRGQFDFPLAATFIIDRDGTIVSAFVEADYTVREDPKEIVRKLQALAV